MKRQSNDPYDLRFGVICSLFYRDILGRKSVPKQIDLLDAFFPGLAVWEVNLDGGLVLRDDQVISDPCAYMESLPPDSIEKPTSPEHVEIHQMLMQRAEENHSWWMANTSEYRSEHGEDFSQFSAIYDDRRRVILAMRQENGTFRLNSAASSGSRESRRVTQLLGRLTGTAKGSQEKERAAASAMQKRMALDLCHNPEAILFYRDHIAQLICVMDEDQLNRFCEFIPEYINGVMDHRDAMTASEKEEEPFPIDDEIFDEAMHNAVYQWNLEGNERQDDPDVEETDDLETTANSFAWLLLLSLLRNECGRLNQTYLSTFQPKSAYRPVNHAVEYTETRDPDLIGKEEDRYMGNDLDSRFPGIEWYCDRCGEYLNIQPGFDDHLPEWKCRKCGCINRISLDEIYDTDAAWKNGEAPVNREAFTQALKERTEERADEIRARLIFRDGLPEDGPELADLEEICFPPGERISRDVIVKRAADFPDQFLVAYDPKGRMIAGCIAGVATDRNAFSDEFFTDPAIHDPTGRTIMITGLEVRSEYRHIGLATELMNRFIEREREGGRRRIVLTCLERLVPFYENMGYRKIGLSESVLGGEAWYEMDMML